MTSLPSLSNLVDSYPFRNGHFKEFVKLLLRQLTLQTSSERAILWLYQPSKGSIKNYCVYALQDDAYYSNDVLHENDHQFFFDLLKSNVQISIGDVGSWENLKGIKNEYCRPYNIHSLLGVQVWNKGNLFGFLVLESNKRAKNWKPEDQVLLANASALISQGYDHSLSRREQRFLEENTPDFDTIFNDVPIPILIFDAKNFQVFEANELASDLCGYSPEDFRKLTLKDILVDFQVPLLLNNGEDLWNRRDWQLQHKNGNGLFAQVKSSQTSYSGNHARIAVITEVTKSKKSIGEVEKLEQKLTDHAFYTSHYVRGPIANILGLMDLIKLSWEDRENYEDLLFRLKIQIMNLDEAVRVMTAKVELD